MKTITRNNFYNNYQRDLTEPEPCGIIKSVFTTSYIVVKFCTLLLPLPDYFFMSEVRCAI